AGGGEPEAALRAAERDDDKDDLEPLEEHALERDREGVPVEAGLLFVARRRGFGALPPERLVLVMHGLVAARAEDRLSEPLHPEREQERPDAETERRDRHV